MLGRRYHVLLNNLNTFKTHKTMQRRRASVRRRSSVRRTSVSLANDTKGSLEKFLLKSGIVANNQPAGIQLRLDLDSVRKRAQDLKDKASQRKASTSRATGRKFSGAGNPLITTPGRHAPIGRSTAVVEHLVRLTGNREIIGSDKTKLAGWRAFHAVRVEDLQELPAITPRDQMKEYVEHTSRVFEQAASNHVFDLKNRIQVELDKRFTSRIHHKRQHRITNPKHLRPVLLPPSQSPRGTASRRSTIRRDSELPSERASLEETGSVTFITQQNQTNQGESEENEGTVDIMTLLEPERLNDISKHFESYPGEALTLPQFVHTMKPFLPFNELGEVQLVRSLSKLFDDVDVNGDGTMEWEEFTNYVIDAGMNSNSNQAQSDRIHEYSKASVIDDSIHDVPLSKLVTLDEEDNLLVWGKDCPGLTVMNSRNLKVVGQIDTKTIIHDVAYLSSLSLLATTSNSRRISLYDPLKQYCHLESFACRAAQVALSWYDAPRTLFSVDSNNDINVWRHGKKEVRHELELLHTFNSSQRDVLDLLMLDNLSLLASAALEGTIGLFDVNASRLSHFLSSEKSRGVMKLAYQPDYHCLISAGYDHFARIWDPYVSSHICILTGHNNPLVGVDVLEKTPQIITADVTGVVKIWDVRNYGCIQTFNVTDMDDTNVRQLNAFSCSHKHKRLFFGSDRVFTFDGMSDAEKNPKVTDASVTTWAMYNDHKAAFVTVGGNRIKIWNACDGKLMDVYTIDDLEASITSMCFDDSEKKLIIGDSSGTVRILNLLNGAEMKRTDVAHNGTISSVCYVGKLQAIVTASWDKLLRYYSDRETDSDAVLLLKEVREHSDEVTCCSLSSNLTLVATGSANGTIIIWDYEANTIEQKIIAHSSEITAVEFLDPYPLLLSSDGEGNICLWTIRPILWLDGQNPCLLRLLNRPVSRPIDVADLVQPIANPSSLAKASPVIAAKFYAENQLVFTGDSAGNIKIWSLTMALWRWGVKPFTPAKISRREEGDEKRLQLSRLESYEAYRVKYAKMMHNLKKGFKMLARSDIKVLKQWAAHEDAVNNLSLRKGSFNTSRAIVSCGSDGMVKIWDLRGNALGVLHQGRGTHDDEGMSPWRFFVDTESRKQEATEKALKVIEEIRTFEDA